MKLISMVDFVLYYRDKCKDMVDYIDVIENYAKFLKQPLTLGMFIPCDLEGNVLEEPDFWDANGRAYDPKLTQRYCDSKIKEYQKAKERVLFEGFMLIHIHNKRYKQALVAKDKEGKGQFDIYDYETIEDLVFMDLTLTQTAIKQLGL